MHGGLGGRVGDLGLKQRVGIFSRAWFDDIKERMIDKKRG